MSGTFFANPAIRFSGRLSLFQVRMRYRVWLLFRWLTGADSLFYARVSSRRHEAEFPVAAQIALLVGTLRGSRARDRASIDALRPKYNWMKPEDQYDISLIGEKWPAFARRLPQKGRQQSPTPARRTIEGAGEEIVLAKNNGAFYRRKTGIGGQTYIACDAQQRLRGFAFAAQT